MTSAFIRSGVGPDEFNDFSRSKQDRPQSSFAAIGLSSNQKGSFNLATVIGGILLARLAFQETVACDVPPAQRQRNVRSVDNSSTASTRDVVRDAGVDAIFNAVRNDGGEVDYCFAVRALDALRPVCIAKNGELLTTDPTAGEA